MTLISSDPRASDSIIDDLFERHFAAVGQGVRGEQRDVIESILQRHNTLSLMPTGGGKSLSFWIAGMALGGTTLVIFPLTALMDEQALKLRGHGLDVTVLHSGLSSREQYSQLVKLYRGQLPNFIFTSPERLATDGFLEYVLQKRRDSIKLVVIDEIHCISQWGDDFRPFYKEIPSFIDAVFDSPAHWPTILGLTATLNSKDTEQICTDFRINSSRVLKSQYLLRYPIHINVIKVEDEPTKDEMFWEELSRHRSEKVLVYIDNRRSGERSTEKMSARANHEGYAAAYFHGSMSSEDKAEVIRKFKSGEVLTVFATSAFGMGIDIPDIRGVIHYRLPESIEQYYQQIGRVGRDAKPAWALLYYSQKNIDFHKTYFIDKSFPSDKSIQDAFSKLTTGKGRIKTFNYFVEEDAQSAFHYLVRSKAVQVLCKGFQGLGVFAKIVGVKLPEFDAYQAATKSGGTVAVAHRSNVTVEKLTHDIYGWLAEQRIKPDRSPQKCLVVEQLIDELPAATIAEILEDTEQKKRYRYRLLDEFVRLLEAFRNSITFHQEIGRYLGVDEFQLGRIHQTVSGVMVRSKSEVIIANLLTSQQVSFEYETRLEAAGYGFWPDFTIVTPHKTFYWEHLGRLDLEQYRQNWEIKRRWYEEYFPGQLITTEETSTLSQIAEAIIKQKLMASETPPNDIEQRSDMAAGTVIDPAPKSDLEPSAMTDVYQVRVLTEGPTDWKHLKAAVSRLKRMGRFANLEIEFSHDEQEMGDKELLTTCRSLGRVSHAKTTVCIFDRDVPSSLSQVVDEDKGYRSWGNRVYSLALPVPGHRETTPNICIEFYYRDEEIQRKDEPGRRLFIGTEFHSRTGQHLFEPLNCTALNKVGKFTIIDAQVFPRDSEENVALSKNDFAGYVLRDTPNFDDFDLSAFVSLFQLIEKISRVDAKNA